MSATQTQMENPYVDYHHEGYWVRDTRVSLDSIVYRWREGLSPETIQSECFPTLTLAQVFGALAFYLDHQAEVDSYLLRAEAREIEIAEKLRETYPEIHRKMDAIIQGSLQAQTQ